MKWIRGISTEASSEFFVDTLQQSKYASSLFWRKKHTHRQYLDWLGSKLHYVRMDDWYKVTKEDFYNHGGKGLIQYCYKDSPYQTLKTAYPEHEWIPWKFKTFNPHYWKDTKNHKKYLDWLGKQLKITHWNDWYTVSQDTVFSNGGKVWLQNYYNGNLYEALQVVYPEQNWIPWKFPRISVGFLDNEKHCRELIKWLESELKIKVLDDWYRVSVTQIRKLAQLYNLGNSDAIIQLLSKVYSSHNWDLDKLFNPKWAKSSQRMLLITVKDIFPDKGEGEKINLLRCY